jgi:hypothetical protein
VHGEVVTGHPRAIEGGSTSEENVEKKREKDSPLKNELSNQSISEVSFKSISQPKGREVIYQTTSHYFIVSCSQFSSFLLFFFYCGFMSYKVNYVFDSTISV